MDRVKTDQQPQNVTRGPVEGIIIVDGRPRMERVDMPTISFESILALQRRIQDGPICPKQQKEE